MAVVAEVESVVAVTGSPVWTESVQPAGLQVPLAARPRGQVDDVAIPTVGVPEIDDDHRELIALYTALVRALQRDHDVETFALGFHGLIHRVRQHFAREERLMQAVGYNGLACHRVLHRKFLHDAEDFLVHVIERHDETECLTDLFYVRHWLANHVLSHDRKIGEFLAGRIWSS